MPNYVQATMHKHTISSNCRRLHWDLSRDKKFSLWGITLSPILAIPTIRNWGTEVHIFLKWKEPESFDQTGLHTKTFLLFHALHLILLQTKFTPDSGLRIRAAQLLHWFWLPFCSSDFSLKWSACCRTYYIHTIHSLNLSNSPNTSFPIAPSLENSPTASPLHNISSFDNGLIE